LPDFKFEIADFLKSIGVEVSSMEDPGYPDIPERDFIFVRSHQLVIELFRPHLIHPIQEHQRSLFALRAKGFRVVRIWEDQWLYKKAVICSRLTSLSGRNQKLPGRVCQVRRIDKVEAQAFLDKNHLQGYVSSKVKYGLFVPQRYYRLFAGLSHDFDLSREETLVAVMTFSNPKKFYLDDRIVDSYEMIRFGTAMNFSVVGGLNKLLNHFMKEKKSGNVMTYADADWSDGSTYQKMGFKMTEILPPISFRLNENNERERSENGDIYNSGSLKLILEF